MSSVTSPIRSSNWFENTVLAKSFVESRNKGRKYPLVVIPLDNRMKIKGSVHDSLTHALESRGGSPVRLTQGKLSRRVFLPEKIHNVNVRVPLDEVLQECQEIS